MQDFYKSILIAALERLDKEQLRTVLALLRGMIDKNTIKKQ